MGCGPCGTQSAISDASAVLVNNFGTNTHFSGALTMLLRALDQVEIRMRAENAPVTWKPSQFPQRDVPYGRKPEGTEVISKNTPIYFVENEPYVYDFHTPGPEGGLCEGSTLCSEPPANKIPGDTWQSFTWRMRGTAWETPLFCLKDLLFHENGMEMLANFLKNVERTPFDFYNNYIRNEIWRVGEKYGLAETTAGLLWNSPDRVTKRVAPNFTDFLTYATAADFAAPKVVTLQYLKYILGTFLGPDITPFNVAGQPTLMMVGTEPDLFSIMYNDTDAAPADWVQGGAGYNLFTFQNVSRLPFAFKDDPDWFRGDFDVNGEFQIIPSKVYVGQNGGADLRVNPAWLTAEYGVMTFMTASPFIYRQFGNLPGMPSNVPAESTRFLRPRFQFVPLLEKCNYARGLVQWRAEDEFGFQPTGEKIIHVIYRRDGLGSYIREAKVGEAITLVTSTPATVPVTCAVPQVLGCCPVAGTVIEATDYRDTSYAVTYTGDILTALGIDIDPLPADAQFATAKGTFDVVITAVSSDGKTINFSVDPTQHVGGHFCCTDQLLGFVDPDVTPTTYCQALLDGGLRPDPFVPTRYIGQLSQALDAVATDTVAVFFDSGCGYSEYVELVIYALDTTTRRITFTIDPADFPDGVNCDDAVKVCAFNSAGCESCVDVAAADCTADDVTPIDMNDDDHES